MQTAASVVLVALLYAGAQAPPPKADPWAPYRFLIGTWAGEGQGQPGNSTGRASFKLDLDDRVLVRISSASVPPRGQQAGYVHRDLLVVYRDAPGQPARAIYWDNEDHTIEYEVTASANTKVVTFVSKASPSAPRFRLVYTQLDDSRVDVKFEMAPPGSPDAFKVYTQAVTRKVGP